MDLFSYGKSFVICDDEVPVEIVERVAVVMSRFVDADNRVQVDELLEATVDPPAGEDWNAMTGPFFAGLAAHERRAMLVAIFTFLTDYDEGDE